MTVLRRTEFLFFTVFSEVGLMAALLGRTLAELPAVLRGKRRTLLCMMEFGLYTLPLASFIGLFIGVPRTEALQTDQPLDLDRIMLFKKNLEKICQDEEDLIDQIQITLRHEVGHYLGLDEDDLERLGLA